MWTQDESTLEKYTQENAHTPFTEITSSSSSSLDNDDKDNGRWFQ